MLDYVPIGMHPMHIIGYLTGNPVKQGGPSGIPGKIISILKVRLEVPNQAMTKVFTVNEKARPRHDTLLKVKRRTAGSPPKSLSSGHTFAPERCHHAVMPRSTEASLRVAFRFRWFD